MNTSTASNFDDLKYELSCFSEVFNNWLMKRLDVDKDNIYADYFFNESYRRSACKSLTFLLGPEVVKVINIYISITIALTLTLSITLSIAILINKNLLIIAIITIAITTSKTLSITLTVAIPTKKTLVIIAIITIAITIVIAITR